MGTGNLCGLMQVFKNLIIIIYGMTLISCRRHYQSVCSQRFSQFNFPPEILNRLRTPWASLFQEKLISGRRGAYSQVIHQTPCGTRSISILKDSRGWQIRFSCSNTRSCPTFHSGTKIKAAGCHSMHANKHI